MISFFVFSKCVPVRVCVWGKVENSWERGCWKEAIVRIHVCNCVSSECVFVAAF